jgi:ORF6N domain
MSNEQLVYAVEAIGGHIATVRGQKVILDADLARIYGVATKVLNQAVKRNSEKFPSDFMFQLAPQEVVDLKSQMVTSNSEGNRSQIVTGSQKHRDPRFLPNVFTEHGAIMAATVLNSPQAVQMSVFVVRAFVAMRSLLTDTRELARKLAKLEAEVKARLDTHDMAIIDILGRFLDIINPPESPQPEPTPKQIGFGVRERGVRYRTKRG